MGQQTVDLMLVIVDIDGTGSEPPPPLSYSASEQASIVGMMDAMEAPDP